MNRPTSTRSRVPGFSQASSLFSLLLFLVFVLCALFTIMIGSRVYENIQQYIPSTLMASGELLDGQVIAVEAKPHTTNATVSASGDMLLVSTDKQLLDLTFTVECNVVNTITSEIGTQEVRLGKSHIIKTDKFEMSSGTITYCVWGDEAE